MNPADLLSALDPEQRQVAETLRGPVRVLAGAGTGKTRAITHRIAHGVHTGVYAPTEVLAVTFTARAAGEMRTRLRSLGASGVQSRTFHAAALRQLRWFWPRVHGQELPTLTESKIPLLALAASRQRVKADQAMLRDLASEVEWAKVSNVSPEEYPRLAPRRGRSVTGADPETVARIFAGYEETKRDQGRMDMEDVLLYTAGMLADDERVAAQVRRQYKWFVVDEFQDVSPLQWALLQLWLGGRDELCVVGDPAQTIYSFAGANADYLRNFTQSFPNAMALELVRNYRSTPNIVDLANDPLQGTVSAGVNLKAQRPAGPPVTFTEYPDEVAEAAGVADAVAGLIRSGVSAGEIAVLFRINAQSTSFEEALSSRGLPFVVRGAGRFFDRGEVREAVTRIRGAARSGQTEGGLVEVVRGTLAGMGWTSAAPTTRGQTRDRWESWQALVDQAEQFATSGGDLSGFVDELDRRAADQHAPVADGVTLASLHTTKGLEWDAVFVVGLQEGTLPIIYAQSPPEIEEERRLLYVGLTRARTHLSASWSLARQAGGRANRKPSRFLIDVSPTAAQASATQQPKPSRNRKAMRCKECGGSLASAKEKRTGRCVDCPPTYDEALFERLKAWRKARAEADKVPAFVLFSDATLELVAQAVPTTDLELLKVSGVGKVKLDKYGADLLEVVSAVPEQP